jgi:hypothetical protein
MVYFHAYKYTENAKRDTHQIDIFWKESKEICLAVGDGMPYLECFIYL